MKLELDTTEEPKLRSERIQLIETPEAVVLRRGRVEISITGDRAAEVIRAVLTAAAGGTMSRTELCDIFPAPDRPAIEDLIRQLELRRILTPVGESSGPPPGEPESALDIFYWHFGDQTAKVEDRLSERRFVIIGVNAVSRQLALALTASGVHNYHIVDYPLLCNLRFFDECGALANEQWPESLSTPLDYTAWAAGMEEEAFDCLIVTSDFGGLELMREWNRFCLRTRRHFLPVVLQDLIGYVGPLVIPGETACFECFRSRRNSQAENPEIGREVESAAFEGQAVAGSHPAMTSILGDIAAMELSRHYGGWTTARLAGGVIEVNLLDIQMEVRRLLKVPRCHVCSALNARSSATPDKDVYMPGHPVGQS
jgi:bacteriocin biosynthesis cyclodehydratase domain-containing protein